MIKRAVECVSRVLSHWWFFTTCLSFIVVSSIPRIGVVVDLIVIALLYVSSLNAQPNSLKTSILIIQDFKVFSFSSSLLDFMLISLFRSICFFHWFAYRQLRYIRNRRLLAAVFVCFSSSFYTVLKLIFLENNRNQKVLIYSLFSSWSLVLLYSVLVYRATSVVNVRSNARLGNRSSSDSQWIVFDSQSHQQRREPEYKGKLKNLRSLPILHDLKKVSTSDISVKVVHCRRDYRLTKSNWTFYVLVGLTDHLESWISIADELLCTYTALHKVVLVDLYRKSSPHWRDKTHPRPTRVFAKLMSKIIPRVKWGHSTALIAHTLACNTAQAFAITHPSRLNALVLISPVPSLDPFAAAILKTRLHDEEMCQLLKTEFNEIVPNVLGEDETSTKKKSRGFLKKVDLKLMRLLLECSDETKNRRVEEEIETVVVTGSEDLEKFKKYRNALAKRNRAKKVFLQNCGHFPHIQNRKEMIAILGNVLAKTDF